MKRTLVQRRADDERALLRAQGWTRADYSAHPADERWRHPMALASLYYRAMALAVARGQDALPGLA